MSSRTSKNKLLTAINGNGIGTNQIWRSMRKERMRSSGKSQCFQPWRTIKIGFIHFLDRFSHGRFIGTSPFNTRGGHHTFGSGWSAVPDE